MKMNNEMECLGKEAAPAESMNCFWIFLQGLKKSKKYCKEWPGKKAVSAESMNCFWIFLQGLKKSKEHHS
jgi:hypothetical protein